MSFNDSTPLYNFYFRYKWSEVDFASFQDSVVGTLRDGLGSLMGPALVSGGVASAGTGLSTTVTAYVAIGPDGFLHVRNSSFSNVAISTADPTNPRKDLIVARKSLVTGTTITRPTSPFDTVALTTLQKTQVVVIPGTPAASPVYPSKAAGDVILAGVRVNAGATTPTSFDDSIAELPRGSNFGRFFVGTDLHGTVTLTGDSGASVPTLNVTAAGAHPAINAIGGTGASGNGLAGTGGSSGDASGIVGVGGASNGNGATGIGTGTGAGVVGLGGATAGSVGVEALGGGTNGVGVKSIPTGNGDAFQAVPANSTAVGFKCDATPHGGYGADLRSTADALYVSGDNIGIDANSNSNNGRAVQGSQNNVGGFAGWFNNGAGGIAALVSNGGGTPTHAPFRFTANSGAPTGFSDVGDMYVTAGGVLKICTVAGTPGTYVSVGSQT